MAVVMQSSELDNIIDIKVGKCLLVGTMKRLDGRRFSFCIDGALGSGASFRFWPAVESFDVRGTVSSGRPAKRPRASPRR
jgi:hypothetical protein